MYNGGGLRPPTFVAVVGNAANNALNDAAGCWLLAAAGGAVAAAAVAGVAAAVVADLFNRISTAII